MGVVSFLPALTAASALCNVAVTWAAVTAARSRYRPQELDPVAALLPDPAPGVSVFSVLDPNDDELEECIESWCASDYPLMQLLLGVHSDTDAAWFIAQRVAARHPALDVQVLRIDKANGPNLEAGAHELLATHARYDLWWFVQSNVRCSPTTLRTLVSELTDDAALVANPVVAIGEQSELAAMENLQQNTSEWSAQSLGLLWNGSLPMGFRSALLRRSEVQSIGWERLRTQANSSVALCENLRSATRRLRWSRRIVAIARTSTTEGRMRNRWIRTAQVSWSVFPSSAFFLEVCCVPSIVGLTWFLLAPSIVSLLGALGAFGFQTATALQLATVVRGTPLSYTFLRAAMLRPWVFFQLFLEGAFESRMQFGAQRYRLESGGRLSVEEK